MSGIECTVVRCCWLCPSAGEELPEPSHEAPLAILGVPTLLSNRGDGPGVPTLLSNRAGVGGFRRNSAGAPAGDTSLKAMPPPLVEDKGPPRIAALATPTVLQLVHAPLIYRGHAVLLVMFVRASSQDNCLALVHLCSAIPSIELSSVSH